MRPPHNGTFRFWVSDVNKPGYSRTTYFISEDSIIIKEGPYDFIYFAKNYSEDVISFAKKLPQKYKQLLIELGKKIKADSLESTYTNFCLMDGLILSFHFEWPYLEKGTTISNYYLKTIEDVLLFLNTVVPKKYILTYPKEFLLERQEECEINKKLKL